MVCGCLSTRYQQEISELIPEVDRFVTIKEYPKLKEIGSKRLRTQIKNDFGEEYEEIANGEYIVTGGDINGICDFEFKPTTPLCIYDLANPKVLANGIFNGQEIPFLTTQGDLIVTAKYTSGGKTLGKIGIVVENANLTSTRFLSKVHEA